MNLKRTNFLTNLVIAWLLYFCDVLQQITFCIFLKLGFVTLKTYLKTRQTAIKTSVIDNSYHHIIAIFVTFCTFGMCFGCVLDV